MYGYGAVWPRFSWWRVIHNTGVMRGGDLIGQRTDNGDALCRKHCPTHDADIQAYSDRIQMAVNALNTALDLPTGNPTKRQVQTIVDANLLAWTILTEGMHPPSKRRAEDAP